MVAVQITSGVTAIVNTRDFGLYVPVVTTVDIEVTADPGQTKIYGDSTRPRSPHGDLWFFGRR
jgi:hypothetical protein